MSIHNRTVHLLPAKEMNARKTPPCWHPSLPITVSRVASSCKLLYVRIVLVWRWGEGSGVPVCGSDGSNMNCKTRACRNVADKNHFARAGQKLGTRWHNSAGIMNFAPALFFQVKLPRAAQQLYPSASAKHYQPPTVHSSDLLVL